MTTTRPIAIGWKTGFEIERDRRALLPPPVQWEDTGLSCSDAQVLARTWGFSDPYDAKLKAADLFTNGREQQVRNGLGD